MLPRLTKAENLLLKIKGVLAREPFREQNKKKSIRYLANLDLRHHRHVVVITKEWLKKGKLYSTCAYFHIKGSWDISNIIFRINSMSGPGEML